MTEWRIERLDRGHVRKGFDCGKPSLNDFLNALVSQYEKRNLGQTYVALEGEDRRVLGYYTLASGEIEAGSLPAKQAKKLPRHPVPTVLLARLAVSSEHRAAPAAPPVSLQLVGGEAETHLEVIGELHDQQR